MELRALRHLINLLKTLGFGVFLGLLTGAVETQSPYSKKEAIAFLKSYSDSNRTRLREIDQQIRTILMNTYNADVTSETQEAVASLGSREIEVLTLKRKEHQLRENFLDRLIFSIDQKYSSGPWQAFLAQQVIEMASIEATSLGADSSFVNFCGYLSAALKRIPERGENLFAFLEGYIEFSTIMNPRPPSEYLKHRSYTNGRTAELGQGVSQDLVGDLVEERLQRLAYLKSLERKSFEERVPILKPLDITLEKRDADAPSWPPQPVQSQAATAPLGPIEAKLGKTEGTLEPANPSVPEMDTRGLQLRIQIDDIHRTEPSKNKEADRVLIEKQTYDQAL